MEVSLSHYNFFDNFGIEKSRKVNINSMVFLIAKEIKWRFTVK